MRVIFLDIDGVLNGRSFYERRRNWRKVQNHETDYYNRAGFDGRFEIDHEAVVLLNELVKRTDAYLVLSSTWRLGERGPDKLDGLEFTKRALELNGFEHNDRFLGKTPRFWEDEDGKELVRGDEIQAWMDDWPGDEAASISSFIILDDDSDMAHLLPRLVWTPNWTGLTTWKCEEAEAMLLDRKMQGSYSQKLDKELPPRHKRPRLKLKKKTGTRR